MNNVHFAIPEIYGETLSYYELLRKLVDKTNDLIDNYNTVPEQIAEAVENLDASQLFSEVLNQLIHSIATDNTKSSNAVKVYKKHDLLYATFNETVNLYESIIDFTSGTETELIPGTNIREVNISELFIELRKLIDDEAQKREHGDTTLQNAINTETSERSQTDTTLQQNINAETSAREQADTTLQQNINAETSSREQADTALQTNIEKIKTYVTPEMFGAVGDGVHDDTTALQSAINYAETNKISILGNSKNTYKITKPLDASTVIFDFNNATITNYTDNDYAIKINKNFNSLDGLPWNCTIKNINIDCNNNSGIDIAVNEGRFFDIKLTNIGGVGIHNRLGYETIIQNIYYQGNKSKESVGLIVDTADTHYINHIGKDLYTAIKLKAPATMEYMHFWIGDIELYDGSTFIECGCYQGIDLSASNCDTYSIFIKYTANISPSAVLSDCTVIYNDSFIKETSLSYLIYIPNATNYRYYLDKDYITNCRFSKPSKGSYRLCNQYNKNEYFPLRTNNTNMESRMLDFVDLTNFNTVNEIVQGKIKIKYGEAIVINIKVKITANTNNIFYIEGVSNRSCFYFDNVQLSVGITSTDEYTIMNNKYANIHPSNNDLEFACSTKSGDNIPVGSYVYINAYIPLKQKE